MPSRRIAILAAAALAPLGANALAQTTPSTSTSPAAVTGSAGFQPAPSSAPASSASLKEALTQGKLSANARVRYENVDQDTLQDADALTARLRLGYTTRDYHGFQAMLEGEAVSQLAGD
ncbi:MAG: hypothetical protein H7067_18395, partial [Burkholderiales bacterium]|nr:hypothetical protein [Opitutaceae bacterium]